MLAGEQAQHARRENGGANRCRRSPEHGRTLARTWRAAVLLCCVIPCSGTHAQGRCPCRRPCGRLRRASAACSRHRQPTKRTATRALRVKRGWCAKHGVSGAGAGTLRLKTRVAQPPARHGRPRRMSWSWSWSWHCCCVAQLARWLAQTGGNNREKREREERNKTKQNKKKQKK